MNVRYDGGICEYIALIVVRTSRSCLTILVSKSLRLLLRTQTNEGEKKQHVSSRPCAMDRIHLAAILRMRQQWSRSAG